MVINDISKVPFKFCCEKCDYYTVRKSQFDRHLLTAKHKMVNNDNKKVRNDDYICECGRKYKYFSGISRHKKSCSYDPNFFELNKVQDDKSNIYFKDLIIKLMTENKDVKNTLVKENEDLRKQIGELIPKVGNTINNKFNINVFLNEKCKDALNMNDFIKSIEISLEQLDFTKNNGLIKGLSNAIIENMNKLSLYERPLHCTDVKRETLYIKDNDNWEKDSDKTKIKKAIKDVSNKQFKSIKKWTDANPDFKENNNKQDYFAKVLSILGKESANIDEQIIKHLCTKSYLVKNDN
tara:strand:- start:390 stop:1271 length:882 start_codon:yes stop_codon:yes gene_type:complete